MGRRSNRKHSKIDGLAPELKATVEQMLLSDATYAEIVDFLEDNGVSISIASVCRYAQDYDANIQALAIAQENFRAMMGGTGALPRPGYHRSHHPADQPEYVQRPGQYHRGGLEGHQG